MEENTTLKEITSEKNRTPTIKETLWDGAKFFIITAAIILPIRLYIAQPFVVSGDSMVSTFESGEYLIVDEISYRFNEPKRGDVIIFRYPLDTKQFFIKRIVGLPGESVAVKNGEVTVRLSADDTITLDEPYASSVRVGEYLETTLGKDEYFVLGDNRKDSSDSRIWGGVPRDLIIGRALVRLFPLAHADILPGAIQQQ